MPASLALRFTATPQALSRLQRSLRALTGVAPTVSTHTQLFFDLPGRQLARTGLALHLERQNSHWQQILRQRSSARVWQCPYAGGFDFSPWLEAALPVLHKPRRWARLERVFEVRLRRSRWATPALHVMLERGTVTAGAVSEAFARLVITRTDGDRAQLFDLADALSASVTLLPEDDDACRRGERLAAGGAAAPARAQPLDLADDADARTAFVHIARACLQHWMANRDGAVATPDDPEYVHQLRIAIRRFRAAVQIFRAVLPDDFVAAVLPPLRELMASLGRSRDLDVLMHEIVTPVVKALPDEPRLAALNMRLTDRLLQARREASVQLDRPQLGRDLLRIVRLLGQLGEAGDSGAGMSLRQFVGQRLRKRLRAARRCADAARSDDPVSLHELRIAIKRLRYSLEFFSSLLPGGTARKVLRRLATLQDDLGQLNDLSSAGALLMANAGDEGPLREAVTLIAGWHGARYADLLADIPRHLNDVRRLRLPRLSDEPAAKLR